MCSLSLSLSHHLSFTLPLFIPLLSLPSIPLIRSLSLSPWLSSLALHLAHFHFFSLSPSLSLLRSLSPSPSFPSLAPHLAHFFFFSPPPSLSLSLSLSLSPSPSPSFS